MESNKWAYIGYAMAWIFTGIAVTMAVYITKSATPIWFMVLPACISIQSGKSNDDTKEV